MTESRFKIDIYDASFVYPLGLYVGRRCWHSRFTGAVKWERLDISDSAEKLRAKYEMIKDLPEYLP